MDHDVIVIGGGPAGASAAIYAGRGGASVCLLHGDGCALTRADKICNYYGTGEITGRALYEQGLKQAAQFACVLTAQAVSIGRTDGGFCVETDIGDHTCKRLVIATGADRRVSDIPGLNELEGSGVSYCAVCDGFFYKKKRVAVLGAGKYAQHEYSMLAMAGERILLTDGHEACFPAEKVYTQKVLGVRREDGVLIVSLQGRELTVDGLFVALGVLGTGGIAKSLGIMTDGRGGIMTDDRGETNIRGVYAAGDCTVQKYRQVASAVCGGMIAGLSAVEDLNKRD